MRFISEVTERGVSERGFELTVGGERVPGIVWAPEGARDPRPVVLLGHGGSQNKRAENIVGLGRRLVRHLGYVAVSIDAPGHGERVSEEEAARMRAEIEKRIASRTRISPERLREMAARLRTSVAEWKATLDAVATLDYVDQDRVGYWGLSMGTSMGVPFVAAEPRVKAAVLGLNGLWPGQDEFGKAAKSITIPLLFIFQWDDELMTREAGMALYDAFSSKDKTMHVNPGGHVFVPLFERDDYEAFFVRHLGSCKG